MNNSNTNGGMSESISGMRSIAEPSIYQIPLLQLKPEIGSGLSYREKLIELLTTDLDFHSFDTGYASHDFHSFPAKFPPQLPEKFILGLTDADDVVLDPMMGSGTTIVEAILNGRNALGFDIDPLARLIATVKTTPLDASAVYEVGQQVIVSATNDVANCSSKLDSELKAKWDPKTQKFIDYWFAKETQIELLALITHIQVVQNAPIRAFLELVFSACIITKSGGVSLAFDLAHTRPHRAKVVYSPAKRLLQGAELAGSDNSRVQFLTKTLRPAIQEFRKRLHQNFMSLQELHPELKTPLLREGDAQALPLSSKSVDLIITSPPYASNAIDYMRAHKFSLVWLGYPVDELSETRSGYIGGESTMDFNFEDLPAHTLATVKAVATLDLTKGQVLHRYYSEMKRVLQEMFRVLKPGKAAIIVVASSVMRGKDTETDRCLAEIGESIGFEVPHIGVRHLDRNKRMMPAGIKIDQDSQIQQRMHEEYVIGFYKPL